MLIWENRNRHMHKTQTSGTREERGLIADERGALDIQAGKNGGGGGLDAAKDAKLADDRGTVFLVVLLVVAVRVKVWE